MTVRLRRFGTLLLPVLAAIALLPVGGAALGATTSLTLEFKRQYAKQHHAQCGKAERFRMFHRRATIEFRGFLTPPSAKHFPVRLELKRCMHGHWTKIGDRSTLGKKLTGKYKGFFSAGPLAPRSHRRKAVAYYSGTAIVGTLRSTKEYFAVTN